MRCRDIELDITTRKGNFMSFFFGGGGGGVVLEGTNWLLRYGSRCNEARTMEEVGAEFLSS